MFKIGTNTKYLSLLGQWFGSECAVAGADRLQYKTPGDHVGDLENLAERRKAVQLAIVNAILRSAHYSV